MTKGGVVHPENDWRTKRWYNDVIIAMSEMLCSPMTSSRYFAQGKGKEKKTKKKKRKEKRKCVRAQAQRGSNPSRTNRCKPIIYGPILYYLRKC